LCSNGSASPAVLIPVLGWPSALWRCAKWCVAVGETTGIATVQATAIDKEAGLIRLN